MKIDRQNPRHWLYLLTATSMVFLTLPARLVKPKKPIVILFGHKLNGNLKYFYDYLVAQKASEVDVRYLTLDPEYTNELTKQGVKALSALRPKDMVAVSRASVVVSTHGPLFLSFYRHLSNLKFADVWHGIPYKGFTPEDFSHMRNYHQIWVSSDMMKDMYVKMYGFKPEQIIVTGYARVDHLASDNFDRFKLLDSYRLPADRKIILFAPTWAQDDKGRSILPFGASQQDFFGSIDKLMAKIGGLAIFRVHLNSSDINLSKFRNVKAMPYGKYPLAEDFLAIADTLITDWSSIAFDYLPLKRPTVFVDVKAPFKAGFSFGPDYRFGVVAKSLPELLGAIEKYTPNPYQFKADYKQQIDHAIAGAYGNTLDGRSSERYFQSLKKLIS